VNNKWGRLSAAAVMVVCFAVAPLPASASETCTGTSHTPVTIGVAGNPVATTPVLQVYLCRDANTGNIDADNLPRVYEEHHGNQTSTAYYEGTGIHLYVPPGASLSSVRLTYRVDDQAQDLVVPVGIGGDAGFTVCLFYTGDAEVNPGGCLLFVED
jgi:hypothetical protein